MNKEQKKPQEDCFCDYHEKIKRGLVPNMPNVHIRKEKPQEDCSYVTTTEHRGNPCKKEGKLQSQEDIFDEFDEEFAWLAGELRGQEEVDYIRSGIRYWIRTNFIAKRDLRKLLEGKKKPIKHELNGAVFSSIRYYNQALDEILAEIEKL